MSEQHEDCTHWRELKKTLRKKLTILEQQATGYNQIHIPVHISLDIANTREEILQLEHKLKQFCGDTFPSEEIQKIAQEPDAPNKTNWFNVVQWSLIGIATFLATLYVALLLKLMLQSAWTTFQLGVTITAIITLLCFSLFSFSMVVAEFSTTEAIAAQNRQRGWIFGGISTIGMIFLVVMTVFSTVIKTEATITLVILAVMLVLLLFPLALANHRLAHRWKNIFDGSMIGIALLMIISTIFSGSIFPFWMTVALGIVGVVLIIVSFVTYMRGESFFDSIASVRKHDKGLEKNDK